MSAEAERAGIVDLRDLASRRAWDRPKLEPLLAALGLVPAGEVRRCFAPPRVLVVIAAYDSAWMVKRTRPWLSVAEHIIVFRDASGFIEDLTEPDVRELIEEEWRDATEGWVSSVVDDLATALAWAEGAARGRKAPSDAMPALSPEVDELPVSPWNPYEAERFDWAFLDRISLHSREVVIAPVKPRRETTPEEARAQRSYNPGFLSLGADPIHRPVGWRGDRMHVYWTWDGQFFTGSDHDYPCGPGKKLYGYEDNDPVQVTLAPDASAYAARFGHDVLLTRAVPLPWQRVGAFDAVVNVRDSARAVFYAQDPARDETWPRPDDISDEDGRDSAPVLVLAPALHYALDLSLRVYRIMNVGDAAERVLVGGPDEGFAVFDGEHRLVRRASGKLIGGWYRWATLEENGAYWREDLVTGERTRIAPIDLAISEDASIEAVARDAILERRFEHAMSLRSGHPTTAMEGVVVYALPRTKNVLLVSKQHVRVI